MTFKKELVRYLRPIFEKKVNENICDWAEKNISLKNTIEGRDGLKFPNFVDSPDFKQIADDIQNPDVKELCLMTSAQRGKTFFLIILLLWLVKMKGYVVMFALCDLGKKNKVRERVKKILQANKEFMGWDDSRGATKGDTFVFENGAQIHWGILSSAATLAETPCDFVLSDEYDEWVDSHKNASINPLRLIQKRTQSKRHGKSIVASTPKVIRGRGGILDIYSEMKKHINKMQCPKCVEWSEFRHEDILTREFDDIGDIKTKGLGYAVCPSCGEELSDSDHYFMSKNPRFFPHPDCENKSEVRKSYHSGVVNATVKNFSSIMYDYHTHAAGGPLDLVDYHNSLWANPLLLNSENKDKEFNELPYNRRTAPDDCQFLIAGADIGNERLHLTVVGFGPKDRSFLVDWDEYNYGGRENFKEIETRLQNLILEADYRTVSGKPLKILYVAIDSNYYTSDVYRMCERSRHIIPVVGSGTLKEKWRQVAADPKNNWNYKNSELKRYELGHDYNQDAFESRISRSYEEGSCFCIPQDTWSNVKEHINNMILVYKPDGIHKSWEQRGRAHRVDWRDCIIYAHALFNILHLSSHIRNESDINAEKKANKEKKSLTSSMY